MLEVSDVMNSPNDLSLTHGSVNNRKKTHQRLFAARRLANPQLVRAHTAAGHPPTVAVLQGELQFVCLLPAEFNAKLRPR